MPSRWSRHLTVSIDDLMDTLVAHPQRFSDVAHRRAGGVQAADRLMELRPPALHLVLKLIEMVARGLRLSEERPIYLNRVYLTRRKTVVWSSGRAV